MARETHEIDPPDTRAESPRDAAMRAEVRRMIERHLDGLPVAFRAVFVMRDVEGMSVEETAACLSIPSATVRTRLFRARALLREALAKDVDSATMNVFGFAGERCDRIVANVLARMAASACDLAGELSWLPRPWRPREHQPPSAHRIANPI